MQQVKKPAVLHWTCRQRPKEIVSRHSLLLRCQALKQELKQLKKKLFQQQASSRHQENTITKLRDELEKTKRQWQTEKTLNESNISREKEMRSELERLRKCNDAATPSKEEIASLVKEKTRRKTKRLQADYEELQVAHFISQQRSTVDLQKEKQTVKHLQEEQEGLRDQAEVLQCELDKQVQQKDILLKYYQKLQAALKSSQETSAAKLRQKEQKKRLQEDLHNEINTLRLQNDTLQSELQKEVQEKTLLLQEHEDLRAALKVSQETLTAELQAERRKADSLQSQLDKVESHTATMNKGCRLISDMKAEQEKMAEERSDLQRNISDMQRCSESQMEELMAIIYYQISLNMKLSTELQAERRKVISLPAHRDVLRVTPTSLG